MNPQLALASYVLVGMIIAAPVFNWKQVPPLWAFAGILVICVMIWPLVLVVALTGWLGSMTIRRGDDDP